MSVNVFQSFEDFMFISNENFEEIPGYYQLVKKPVSESEIKNDYIARMWSSTK